MRFIRYTMDKDAGNATNVFINVSQILKIESMANTSLMRIVTMDGRVHNITDGREIAVVEHMLYTEMGVQT